jgi:hypothetical protein
VEKALALGWAPSQVTTIDEDLGVSGKVFVKRSGFDRLNAEVALGRVGILLSLEVSRLARSNADWYHLLDMCAITDTLLADSVVWGEKEGETRFHPDEAVTGTLRTVFEKFTELGSARQVWLWFRSPIYNVLSNPVYAGAYVYGKTRQERYVDEQGTVRRRVRHLPQEEWSVLLPGHHEGFIDRATFAAIQARLKSNLRAELHQAGRALREGWPGYLWKLRPSTARRLSRHERHTPLRLRR